MGKKTNKRNAPKDTGKIYPYVILETSFATWARNQYRAATDKKLLADYVVQTRTKKLLALHDKESERVQAIKALEFSSFKNSVSQGALYEAMYQDYLDVWNDEKSALKSLRKFAENTGENFQLVQAKRARYHLVNSVKSLLAREALQLLRGNILDALKDVSGVEFSDFLMVLSKRFKAVQDLDIATTKTILNNLANDLLGLKKPKKTKPKSKVPENPPQDPQEDHDGMNGEETVDTSAGREPGPKPVTFRFPSIENLDDMGNTEASNEIFCQALRGFQGLVVSLQQDPLQYLDSNITGIITGLMKDLQVLQDKIRLERASKAA